MGMTFWLLPGVRYLWHASLLAAMSNCPLPPSAFTSHFPTHRIFWSDVKALTSQAFSLGLIISTTPWEGCEYGWSSCQDPNVLFYSADTLCNALLSVGITSVLLAPTGSSWPAFIQLECTIISLGVEEARPPETELYPLSPACFPNNF